MATDSSLLSSELVHSREEELYQQLLQQTMGRIQPSEAPNSASKTIRPQPGLCAKTSSLPDQQKVFLNICQSPQVPLPPPLSHDALAQLLESDDPSGYRVPMSLGEPHTELDNSQQACTVYDVVVNDQFFLKCQGDELFQHFLLAVSLEGLENKYSIELSRECKILKNRKLMGSIMEQNIRSKSKPVIQELDSSSSVSSPPAAPKRPDLCLMVEPASGDPQFLIAEVHLPGVVSARSLVLDVGEDCMVLNARPSLFHLDCCFPLRINQDNSVAQYNTSTQVLCVTMPVVA